MEKERCPFCGSEDIECIVGPITGLVPACVCRGCGAIGPANRTKLRLEAITKWNVRAPGWTSVDDDLPKEQGFFEVVVAPSNYHIDFPEIHSRIRVSKFYKNKEEAIHFYCNVRYSSAARELGEKAQHWAISHEEGYAVTHWRRCPPMPKESTS